VQSPSQFGSLRNGRIAIRANVRTDRSQFDSALSFAAGATIAWSKPLDGAVLFGRRTSHRLEV
jgi:hypothetical protein